MRVPEEAPDTRDTVLKLSIDDAPRMNEAWTLDPLPGALNRLDCPTAELHGKTAKRKNLSLGDQSYDYIYAWTNARDSLSWKFRAPRTVTYEVGIVYNAAAPSAGNAFAVQIGGRSFTAKVQNTGKSDALNTLGMGTLSFKEYTLGTVTIPAGAEIGAAVKPLSIAKGSPLMQFHALILRPLAND